MSLGRLSVRLWLAIVVVGGAIALLCGTPAKGEKVGDIREANKNLPQLGEVELPATSAQTLVQTAIDPSSVAPDQGGVVSITGVVANPTDKGVEIVLQTTQGKILQPVTLVLGRTYIANIPDAVLALPQGGEFRQDNPANGINRVRVTQATANSIRVAVTGETALPQVQLYDAPNEGLVFSFTPGTSAAQTPPPPEGETQPGKPTVDEQEIVVTDEQDEGYNPSSASTATRTDTPLRDIPQSIQVVPRQVLEDRNVRDVTQAVETVSGVVESGGVLGTPGIGSSIIRGFAQATGDGGGGTLRNGFRDLGFWGLSAIETVEQVEVLKGPASVLFGALEPGGIINVVTKQPLSEPYYKLEFEVGNRNFYQPTIDFSDPLTEDDTLLYRFISSYQSSDGIQDFVKSNLLTIAPTITLNLGDRTTLNLYYEYLNSLVDSTEQNGRINNTIFPRDFYPGYPQYNSFEAVTQRYGYTLKHEFSDNWQIRNAFGANNSDFEDRRSYGSELVDDRFLVITTDDAEFSWDNYFAQIDLLGKFNTGSIAHQLLVGFDYNHVSNIQEGFVGATNLPNLDILNPNYDNIPEPIFSSFFETRDTIESYGIYIQDQISLLDNLKVLIGGRFDWVSSLAEGDPDFRPNRESNNNAFSPRFGLVYQPSDTVSLYASYSRSFQPPPVFGLFNADGEGEPFEPTKGTQYEVGIKTDFLDKRLSATLAAYQITKTNVTTPDPIDSRLSIQTGEQRSQGIELDVTGEILPGWKAIASYAYTDAEVTEDNTTPIGNKLQGVPENQASLWTTYEIQSGNLEGLGFGLGLFYVGNRQGDLDNFFTLGDYFRTDAALYYRRGQLNAAVNIRNLFDVDYFDSFSNRQEPFTIVGSVSWEF
ncbi:TonB-dependent siderophore receptor [Chroococcidiopsis sp. CCALA 051]|uniref:TonB-dependent siderophore receptor n=1 Tax=Chroococcidiopsis sp. CCALA 051 TaxID=869949 RepID=UPI000D0D36E9|nr:TonB-dependent siderophore receptor [Chroococcidiopsis sp. CCALA 051]PSM47720.1 TonB-dependent siderophore receptor [Chroococcidiopsis sp. CCALA 051]